MSSFVRSGKSLSQCQTSGTTRTHGITHLLQALSLTSPSSSSFPVRSPMERGECIRPDRRSYALRGRDSISLSQRKFDVAPECEREPDQRVNRDIRAVIEQLGDVCLAAGKPCGELRPCDTLLLHDAENVFVELHAQQTRVVIGIIAELLELFGEPVAPRHCSHLIA